MLPETAILGGFALAIYHFISEITDCTQQQKIGSPADLSPADALFRSWHARALVKMNFHIWYCPQQKKRI